MLSSPALDCLLFDCSPLFKYRLTPAEVHICWCQVAQAFVTALVVVVLHKRIHRVL
jgi:hypothetical protein